MRNSKPIGIFDSGIGGTSIWNDLIKILPSENTIYLSDQKNAPYGTKTIDEIIEYSIQNTEWLINKGCKLIIVACNTATTNVISHLRKHYDIPFIGIEPAIKPALLQSKSGSVAVLATKSTLDSLMYLETSERFLNNQKIINISGTGLVDLIEKGKIHTPEMDALLYQLLHQLNNQDIDHLVLGCTHYPYLINKIRAILGNEICILDTGYPVAKQTKNILNNLNLLNLEDQNNPSYQFYSKGSTSALQMILSETHDIHSFIIKEIHP